MKVFFISYRLMGNPYIKLLKEEIDKFGDFKVCSYSYGAIKEALNRKERFILHIHWPEFLYGNSKNFLKAIFGTFEIASLCLRVKMANNKIVWTVHNVKSHNGFSPCLDILVYELLCKFTDIFIVHTEAGQKFLINKGIDVRKIRIIPHGNYVDYYGQKIKKANAKDGSPTFLNFGLLRSYKGLSKLIKTFNLINQEIKLSKIKLHIIGKRSPFFDLENLKSLILDTNIVVDDHFVPDALVANLLGSADFFIIAHENFLSSGSVILALSYGLPVVAPNEGDMPYIINHGQNGLLYEPTEEESLKRVIIEAVGKSKNEKNKMRKMAIQSVGDFSWNFVAKKTLEVYTD